MHIPGFTEEDIRSALTIEDEENLTQDQIDTLTGLWTDIFDAILAAYTPAHAPMGESEIAAIKQIAMPYIKAATKEFFYADDKLSLAFRHTDQYDEELYYVRTIKTRLMLTAHASGVSMDELSRITGLPKMTIAQQINAVDLTDVNIADYFVYKENLPTYVAKERELEARIRHAHIRQAILMRVAHIKGMDIKTISRLSHVPPLTVAHQIQTLGL